jgi:hypothetical protein
MKVELHRPLAITQIGHSGLDSLVEATPAECVALARRMGVPAVLSLTCWFHLTRSALDAVAVRGRLEAVVVRTCVVSLDDFETDVVEDFRVRFVPAGNETDEIDPEAEDEILFTGGVIDLGEAAVEQLALALDPYPRKPGAELPESEPAPRVRH